MRYLQRVVVCVGHALSNARVIWTDEVYGIRKVAFVLYVKAVSL